MKSDIGYDNIYKPKAKTININLGNIIRKIENDNKISNELKDDFIDAYNNILNKSKLQFHNRYYKQYIMEPVEKYYFEKNVLADDEESITRDDDQLILESNDKEDKLKSNIRKTIVRALSGEGLNINRIKIDESLLKKDILKVRYINSN